MVTKEAGGVVAEEVGGVVAEEGGGVKKGGEAINDEDVEKGKAQKKEKRIDIG